MIANHLVAKVLANPPYSSGPAMLSYRHGFHAGNHADVLKHAVLVYLARYLQQKDGALLFHDSHAGAGLYDLRAPEAEKTGEYHAGIARLLSASAETPELFRVYLEMVRALNPAGNLHAYPGSPSLILSLKRPQDRVVFHELHPADHQRLVEITRREHGVRVEKSDGLGGLIALTPPPEKRGLFLIDPSYEIKTDYAVVITAIARAWKKFPTGTYALWYPVIDRNRVRAMEVALRAAGLRKTFRIELGMAEDTQERGMTGSGLFIVNPPYTLPAAAQAALPWLRQALGAEGPSTAEWLMPE
ncbi:23S rRNA (adenine(2030)-N(6))-methyltransferase RlmJ [Iodidimonas sp. SYSU 1G8]|uniref:23S rRNA (adenine(2030)-N(6))-methyltransferase RlmJ n=1 Tax=Iodidimonas sp. SYSU 1G8 TaxID=3133967 RepID=UPI0031FF0A27